MPAENLQAKGQDGERAINADTDTLNSAMFGKVSLDLSIEISARQWKISEKVPILSNAFPYPLTRWSPTLRPLKFTTGFHWVSFANPDTLIG